MNALSLFSGIGGIDLACEWSGIKTVAFCEREPFCQKVLRKHWPDVPIYDDVCTLTKERLEADGIGTIDIIHGGYPCQPFSHAGKREGTNDDRHLWPEVFRLIQALQPRWFVGENVAGHVTLGLDIVLADLESIGYSWETFVLPACAVNAPHRRDRVFIVAYSNGFGDDSQGKYRIERKWQEKMQERFESLLGSSNKSEDVSNTTSQGLQVGGSSEFTASNSETRTRMELEPERCSEDVANTDSARREECNVSTESTESRQHTRGDFATITNTYSQSESQTCTTIGTIGGGREPRNNARWSSGRCEPGTDWWATEPGMGRVANGISDRTHRLKALGNAVVPQQIYPIIAAIKQIDDALKGATA